MNAETTNTPPRPKALSPVKWVLGVLAFIVVAIGSILIGTAIGPRHNQSPAAVPTQSPVLWIVFLFLGGVALFLGAVVYGVALATTGFTFNFDRPVLRAHGRRMWFVNLVFGLLVQAGFAFIAFPFLARLLSPLIPNSLVFPISYFGPFVLAQLVFVWLMPWAPLDGMLIRKRMARIGIVPEQMRTPIPIGISDPGKSSLKKLGRVEEDLGLLWLSPDNLIYRGDAQFFTIPRDALLEIARVADAGSTSSYFGAVHVILRYRDDGAGVEQRVRLHPQGCWTMTAAARAQDDLAERLETWRISTQANAEATLTAAADATGGFPVTPV